jgi:signal transduction histidine kinase
MESLQHANHLFAETGDRPGRATPSKTPFPDNISHELRSPLNVIIGFAELMLDEVPGKINKEQRQGLDDILSSARRLLDLINRILDDHGQENTGR